MLQGYLGLPNTDVRLIAANLIRSVLGFLGILFLVLILWGGFAWMVSGGNDESRTAAKKTIWNAILGLAIILSSYSIANFIINALTSATTGAPPTGP